MSDEHKYGQPIEDVTIYHDLIDGRKLRSILDNKESALFSPKSSKIIHMHNKTKTSGANITQWVYENIDDRKDAEERLLKALFLYLYRGTEPMFFPPDDDVDKAMEGLVKLIDNSPYADPYRRMCRLNRWHSDVIGRLLFDEILSDIGGLLNGIMDSQGRPEENRSGDGDSDQPDGVEDNQSDNGQDSKSKGEESDSLVEGEGEGEGGGEEKDSTSEGSDRKSDTENSDAEVSTNQQRTDTQTLVNRAIERVREFTSSTEVDPGTSIDKALEAAEKLGDGEKNPFHDRGLINIDMGGIADKMGRMRSIFDAEQATRIEFAPGAVVSLCYGNDIRNVLPQELALMADPHTSVLFDLKYLQRRLLTRKTEGVTRGGKGPIIMCIDVSGSMDVTMLSWAMSLAGAIGYTAASQGRDVAFIYYSDTIPDIITLDYQNQLTLDDLEQSIQSVVFNNGIGSREPHEYSVIKRMREAGIDRTCQANGGGTFYGAAFSAAKDLFELNPRWERGDLLFLTDGGDSLVASSKERCEVLQEMGIRVFGIGLVHSDHGGSMAEVMKNSLGYFDGYTIAKFGRGYSTDDVINQIAKGL